MEILHEFFWVVTPVLLILITGGGRWRYTFLNPPLPGIFHFFYFRLAKLNPWIFHKTVLDPLEIPRPKTETPRQGKFHMLDTPGNSISSPLPPLHCLAFFWNSPFQRSKIKTWEILQLFLYYPWKFQPCLCPLTDRPQVSVWIFSGIAQAQEIATLAQYPLRSTFKTWNTIYKGYKGYIFFIWLVFYLSWYCPWRAGVVGFFCLTDIF